MAAVTYPPFPTRPLPVQHLPSPAPQASPLPRDHLLRPLSRALAQGVLHLHPSLASAALPPHPLPSSSVLGTFHSRRLGLPAQPAPVNSVAPLGSLSSPVLFLAPNVIFITSDYDLNIVCGDICIDETLKCVATCEPTDSICLSACFRSQNACFESKLS